MATHSEEGANLLASLDDGGTAVLDLVKELGVQPLVVVDHGAD
jgi:hypothetical protein